MIGLRGLHLTSIHSQMSTQCTRRILDHCKVLIVRSLQNATRGLVIPLSLVRLMLVYLSQKGCLILQALFCSLINDPYKDPGAWKPKHSNVSIYLLPLHASEIFHSHIGKPSQIRIIIKRSADGVS